MARDTWLDWTLATIGLAGAGFAAGLHRLIWGFFCFATLAWWAFIWWGVNESKVPSDQLFFWWILALGAPLIVGFVLRLVEGIALAALKGVNQLTQEGNGPKKQT